MTIKGLFETLHYSITLALFTIMVFCFIGLVNAVSELLYTDYWLLILVYSVLPFITFIYGLFVRVPTEK